MPKQAAATAAAVQAVLVLLLSFGGTAIAGQQSLPPEPMLKPSEVAVPEGVPLGSYRRVIQPFENWDLICDENLHEKRKICNISQIFVDATGRMVFSWSMAASEDGKPFMIVRVPPETGQGARIALSFPGRAQPVNVPIQACDITVCLGYVPVGPILREQIGKEATAEISYTLPPQSILKVSAPFRGLIAALAAIE